MVEKKESKGILIIAIIGIIIGLLKLSSDAFFAGWSLSEVRSWSTYFVYLAMLTFTALIVISAIYIIKRRNWARALFMFLLLLFIMHDATHYVFTHSGGPLPLFVKLIIFIFSPFRKPLITSGPDFINPFLDIFIYIYIIFTIFYLTRPAVKARFE